MEIPSNNLDDDGSNGVDCQDSFAQNGGSWTDAEVASGIYSCAGTSQTSQGVYDYNLANDPDYSHYCAVGESDASVQLCCETGEYLRYDGVILDTWSCVPTEPCLTPRGFCDISYENVVAGTALLTDWVDNVDCVTKDATGANNLACCPVIKFGHSSYYSDKGNVKVY